MYLPMNAPLGNFCMESSVSCVILYNPDNLLAMLMSRLNCRPFFSIPRSLSSLIKNNIKEYWIVETIIKSTIAKTKDQNNDC